MTSCSARTLRCCLDTLAFFLDTLACFQDTRLLHSRQRALQLAEQTQLTQLPRAAVCRVGAGAEQVRLRDGIPNAARVRRRRSGEGSPRTADPIRGQGIGPRWQGHSKSREWVRVIVALRRGLQERGALPGPYRGAPPGALGRHSPQLSSSQHHPRNKSRRRNGERWQRPFILRISTAMFLEPLETVFVPRQARPPPRRGSQRALPPRRAPLPRRSHRIPDARDGETEGGGGGGAGGDGVPLRDKRLHRRLPGVASRPLPAEQGTPPLIHHVSRLRNAECKRTHRGRSLPRPICASALQ